MVLLTSSFLYDLVLFVVIFLTTFILYYNYKLSYWKRRGVITRKTVFPYGNAEKIVKQKLHFGLEWASMYNDFKKKGQRYGGGYLFIKPVFIPCDLDLVKDILQTNFNHFSSHGIYYNEEGDPLSGHLFALDGERWRNMRVKLTPTFTSGKIKMMFNILIKCGDIFEQVIEKHSETGEVFEIKDLTSRLTIDIIASTAFGLVTNSIEDPGNDFATKCTTFVAPGIQTIITQVLQFFLPHSFLRMANIRVNDPTVANFFLDVIRKTVDYREKNNVYRKDFLHLLLQLKNRGVVSDDGKIFPQNDGEKNSATSITFNQLAAQAFLFYFGGFDTSSNLVSYAFFELAYNPDVQKKLQAEIKKVFEKYDGDLTYDSLNEMKYMHMAILETLRKYPAVPINPRQCTKDYKIPGTNIVIEKGTTTFIPTMAIHYDPDIYPDPDKFDPERFSDENKAKRHPSAWLPFGLGPRECIGLRFALMQIKVCLVKVLKDYDVTLNEKTIVPFRFQKHGLFLVPEGGIWINVSKQTH
ncbi:unnamed protein product [Brassicogethes aeneus]|uniref:Cytochrome P450 n=1 Tax=Brassicogethes aeneus TaxID=1431903 RepID=A0A9P0BDU3_BRAAE|nr:unnamed protein product [Brassicogethes aeneus]